MSSAERQRRRHVVGLAVRAPGDVGEKPIHRDVVPAGPAEHLTRRDVNLVAWTSTPHVER